jgi:hypothetical protein
MRAFRNLFIEEMLAFEELFHHRQQFPVAGPGTMVGQALHHRREIGRAETRSDWYSLPTTNIEETCTGALSEKSGWCAVSEGRNCPVTPKIVFGLLSKRVGSKSVRGTVVERGPSSRSAPSPFPRHPAWV